MKIRKRGTGEMNKYQKALECMENAICGNCNHFHIIEGSLFGETLCDCKKGSCYIHDLEDIVDHATPTKPCIVESCEDKPCCPYCHNPLDGDEEHLKV